MQNLSTYGPQRILSLEDMPSDAELQMHTLRRSGMVFEWQRVDTEIKFKQAIETFQPTIVLTDFNLPSYDGGQAIEYLRVHQPDIPVIVVTGALGDAKVVELLREGAVDYILKDRLGRLPDAVNRALKNARLVAEQRRATRLLQENEAFLSQAQSVARMGSWRWEFDDNKLYWSEQAYRIAGLPYCEQGQAPQAFLRSITHPLDQDNLWDSIVAARKNRSDFTCEIRILQPDGNLRWAQSRAQVVCDAAGTPKKMIGALLDVTERKTLEIELHANLNLLKMAMDSAGQSIWKLNFSTGHMTFGARYYDLLGYGIDDYIHNKSEWLRRVHPEDRARAITKLQQAQECPCATYIDEYRVQAQDGSYRWVQSRGAHSAGQSNDGADMVGVTLDIDDNKRMELEIHHLAYHDRLTGLPNRMLFFDRLGQMISQAKRDQTMVAVLFADLDGFKHVNDTLGHAAGDEVLKISAQRMLACVRGADTVARFGGRICLDFGHPDRPQASRTGGRKAAGRVCRRH